MSVKKIGEWKKKTGKERTKWKQTLDRQYGTKCYNKVRYNDEDFCARWKEIKDSDKSDSKRKLKERKEINNENWQRLHPTSKISRNEEQEFKKRIDECGTDVGCLDKVTQDMNKKKYHQVYGWLRY